MSGGGRHQPRGSPALKHTARERYDDLIHLRAMSYQHHPTISWYDNRVSLRFTQAARKHKVGTSRVRHVIDNPLVTFQIPAPDDHTADRTLYLGDDGTGRALEVLTVPIEGGELVIHAMDLRAKYRPIYDAAKEATTT